MIEQKLEQLNSMTLKQIKRVFSEYFNAPAPNRSKDYFVMSIGYRIQELEYGGLSIATKNLLTQMNTPSEKTSKKKTIAPVGTRIIKTYKGKEYVVCVLENGFALNGKNYKSLSAIAKDMTGLRLSGNAFFGLGKWSK